MSEEMTVNDRVNIFQERNRETHDYYYVTNHLFIPISLPHFFFLPLSFSSFLQRMYGKNGENSGEER